VEQAILYQQDQYHQHGVKVAIAINLSVRLLNDTGFRKKILERLIAHDFFAGGLILEITEDILVPTPMTPVWCRQWCNWLMPSRFRSLPKV
jgi:EAL domain-containing protein (putative c-di-GMP-specific phosphodiesterase class I)